MSNIYEDGGGSERSRIGGSIRAARERAEAGLPREGISGYRVPSQQGWPRGPPSRPPQFPGESRIAPLQHRAMEGNEGNYSRPPRNLMPNRGTTREGQNAMPISRPQQIPQWPLAGPIASPQDRDAGQAAYQPPAGRSQPPQRPPRPSVVPSILDGSRIQDPTPSFQYAPQRDRDSHLHSPQTNPSSASRPSTVSSAASIPDFPLPIIAAPVPQLQPQPQPQPQPRRSINLGPPPSSRRGNSTFYSSASFVSPIPEESDRAKSHTSFASSAAMPESWGTSSPGMDSSDLDNYYDDVIPEEGRHSALDDDEERGLVRSASLGKRAKPALVNTGAPRATVEDTTTYTSAEDRPSPHPVQPGPFRDGTGYLDGSSSSSSGLNEGAIVGAALTVDTHLAVHENTSNTNLSNSSGRGSVSPQPPQATRSFSRLSAIRRPPKLDIDAVKQAEARGSLTSLPDLIKRATALAASLDKGRRPASRLNILDIGPDFDVGPRREFKEMQAESYEKHQSGLSDMLAAFPPPAQQNRRSFRQSLRDQVGSWPFPLSSNNRTPDELADGDLDGRSPDNNNNNNNTNKKKRRRCCGLPTWAAVLLALFILLIIAAAIVLPLYFFVLNKPDASNAQSKLAQCQSKLRCVNGGKNAVSPENVCSCVCANGFTGSDCSEAGRAGCTTTNVVNSSSSNDNDAAQNVTLGNAIPRLIQEAQSNFSIPLSGTRILAAFNSGSLSCSAENALVTFDGQNIRNGNLRARDEDGKKEDFNIMVLTITPGAVTTIVLSPATDTPGFSTVVSAPSTAPSVMFSTTLTLSSSYLMPAPRPTSFSSSSSSSATTTTSTQNTARSASPTAAFTVTEEVLDFARVAVLYILQEEQSLQKAEEAQNNLQQFLNEAAAGGSSSSSSSSSGDGGVTVEQAEKVDLGSSGHTIDLVNFSLDDGKGKKVGKGSGDGGGGGGGGASTKLRRRGVRHGL